MYECFLKINERRSTDWRVDIAAVGDHAGDRQRFMQRYEHGAALALEHGAEGMAVMAPYLLSRIADARTLRIAWDDLARDGDTAPGPNGRQFSDLNDHEVWSLARAIGKAIRAGTYRPGADRRVLIPKGSGRGRRMLTIQNIEDRVVARAAARIPQPPYDPRVDPRSFGFRPRVSRQHALATAITLARRQKRWTWIVDDIRDAFDQVPRKRLLQVLGMALPADVVQFVRLITDNGRKRGLRQGSPLSPLLLNIYLDHFLDRPWKQQFPTTPLLRTADDLLLICESASEARDAYAALRQMLCSAAMPLKGQPGTAIRDVFDRQAVQWLGFLVQRQDSRLAIRFGARLWDQLRMHLSAAHLRPASPLRAQQVVRGWIDQAGPQYEFEDVQAACARVQAIAVEMAFDEISGDLGVLWQRAHARWRRLRRSTTLALNSEV